jgi:hypothetical protein
MKSRKDSHSDLKSDLKHRERLLNLTNNLPGSRDFTQLSSHSIKRVYSGCHVIILFRVISASLFRIHSDQPVHRWHLLWFPLCRSTVSWCSQARLCLRCVSLTGDLDEPFEWATIKRSLPSDFLLRKWASLSEIFSRLPTSTILIHLEGYVPLLECRLSPDLLLNGRNDRHRKLLIDRFSVNFQPHSSIASGSRNGRAIQLR